MYRVLIATNEPNVLDQLNAVTNWRTLYFFPPVVVGTADEAIGVIESQRVDCVAFLLDKHNANRLTRYLNSVRPSLPTFQVKRTLSEQQAIINEARHVLDRLHMDMSDEVCDDETIMTMLRDELAHNLLFGEIDSESLLRGRLQLVRSQIAPDKPCLVFDFDMPQGEIYLTDMWHYGSERLENTLRNNFFGRFHEELYYGVAVLNPRHIRVLVCQTEQSEPESRDDLMMRAAMHVEHVIGQIKQYLGLDMMLTSTQTLDSMIQLTVQGGEAANHGDNQGTEADV